MRVKHPATAPDLAGLLPLREPPATPEERREADILDAQALLIEICAIHLAFVKRFGTASPILYEESAQILPRLMEARGKLGAGWSANDQVAHPLPVEHAVFLDLLRRLNAAGWTRHAFEAGLAALQPLLEVPA